jgi:hypothetical protein
MLITSKRHLRLVLSEYPRWHRVTGFSAPTRTSYRTIEIHHNRHWPHRFLHAAAPLKPLPEQVDLEQYHVRSQARAGGLINEYRLVA